jgi:hypothetical protein
VGTSDSVESESGAGALLPHGEFSFSVGVSIKKSQRFELINDARN